MYVCLCMYSVVDCHEIDAEYTGEVGVAVQYMNESLSTTYGSLVSATCRQGSAPVGDTVWKCRHTGLWSTPDNFHCRRQYHSQIPISTYTWLHSTSHIYAYLSHLSSSSENSICMLVENCAQAGLKKLYSSYGNDIGSVPQTCHAAYESLF